MTLKSWWRALPLALWCFTSPASASEFVDLSAQTPGSPTVCAAIQRLKQSGHELDITVHSLSEEHVRSTSDPRRNMTAAAWSEATSIVYGINHYTDVAIDLARINLNRAGPKDWIYSTWVGSLHNPLVWIFSSAPDGSKAEHLAAQLGYEGSGPFDTYFVRFKNQPYAVTRAIGERGSYLDVYSLDPAKNICSFGPS